MGLRAELEQQEAMGRLEIAEQQALGAVALAERQPSMAVRLSDAQSAMQAIREQCEALEEALEEKEAALAGVSRELEALRDSQAGPDAEVQQREVGRLEAERRAAIASEQRAALVVLQEGERLARAGAMGQAMATVVHAEAAARQAIALEEQAGLADLGGAVRAVLVQGLVAEREEAVVGRTAATREVETLQLAYAEAEQRVAAMEAEQSAMAELQQWHAETRMMAKPLLWSTKMNGKRRHRG